MDPSLQRELVKKSKDNPIKPNSAFLSVKHRKSTQNWQQLHPHPLQVFNTKNNKAIQDFRCILIKFTYRISLSCFPEVQEETLSLHEDLIPIFSKPLFCWMQGSGITTSVPFSNKARTKTKPKPRPDLIHMSGFRAQQNYSCKQRQSAFSCLPVTAAHAILQHTHNGSLCKALRGC